MSKFDKDDFVRNIQDEKCSKLNDYFNGYYKRVLRVEDVDYEYAGNQFIYVDFQGHELGLYASAIEKL